MNKSMLTRGFTLIELLVVIAIIGILAAVVIGSLNDARSSGQDASIKQSMANVRQQAELHYNSSGYTYTGVCSAARVITLIDAALDVVGASANYAAGTHGVSAYRPLNSATAIANRTAACHETSNGYVVATPLTNPAADNTDYWCVDSTGTSKQTDTQLAANAIVCP